MVDIAFWFVVVVAAVLVLAEFGVGALGIAGLPLIAFGYLIKGFVLGFPELILSPPQHPRSTPSDRSEIQKHVGRTSTTTAPLRPQGDITIDGRKFPASSDGGTMIESGKMVKVVGFRNGSLLVIETENEEGQLPVPHSGEVGRLGNREISQSFDAAG